jgi:hypothetical protein
VFDRGGSGLWKVRPLEIDLVEAYLFEEARRSRRDQNHATSTIYGRLGTGVELFGVGPEGTLIPEHAGECELTELIGSHRETSYVGGYVISEV